MRIRVGRLQLNSFNFEEIEYNFMSINEQADILYGKRHYCRILHYLI